ncbi:MAG: hypothetical protein HY459_04455 [Parcubacteria group bacterium]|nr:hypothetical protein [Parcubacteria group bacterium]
MAEGRAVNLAEVLGIEGLFFQCETSDRRIVGRGETLEAAAADAARQRALWQTIEFPQGRDV